MIPDDWKQVIDRREFERILPIITELHSTKKVFPNFYNIFDCFNQCRYEKLKVVIIGMDPYPQEGFATGLAFANPIDKQATISPSLQLIKDCLAREFTWGKFESDCFDPTLKFWAEQGVLLLNSALTVEENKPNSHTELWYPFIKKLLINLSEINSGIVYILLGDRAKTLGSFINKNSNYIFKYKHPAYYSRLNQAFECDGFKKAQEIILKNYNTNLLW